MPYSWIKRNYHWVLCAWTCILAVSVPLALALSSYDKAQNLTTDCTSMAPEIREMHNYGRVDVGYLDFRSNDLNWHATFNTRYDSDVRIELKTDSNSACQVVHLLYEKFKTFPFSREVPR